MPFTLQLGDSAPDFDLPGVDGRFYSLQNFADARILVIAFSCVHCPYVVGSEERMMAFQACYGEQNVAFVAMNSNAKTTYADDSLQGMTERARQRGFQFPFLHDETQQVALDYGALKTPHYFVFDEERKLRYTGRMDDNPRHPGLETTSELRDAVDALLQGRAVEIPLTNPIGCNVKWAGKDKHWMPADACDIV
ncbi:Peroxiredoxin [Abditibacterium utsteinense]|uniref:Peroxiredoxin n=1 Tax=Abditibacterium utsteinense TaxID=1960156 RepID=A0A2S8SQY9_9BACT|nr:thioredoxin family protein [Abditibacterium utsteinense]PQV63224.1 Peroxiredoxin [Abditibacterium utsteinense]